MEFSVPGFSREPDGGDAAQHAVVVGAGCRGEWGLAAGPVHDEVEAFLEIVDRGEVVDERGEFIGEVQGEDPK